MAQSYKHLDMFEREEISRGIALGVSLQVIARGLPRDVSTVSREIRRHAGSACAYRAAPEQRRRPVPAAGELVAAADCGSPETRLP